MPAWSSASPPESVGTSRLPTRCDVLVIGAGIGGLSCANYLAKAGAHVVLVEKHYVPGGYCSSFKRGPYYFDAAAHSLGSCRPQGQVGRLLTDHRLEKRLTLLRYSPTDVVVTRNRDVFFFSGPEETVRELQREFPHEAAAVRKFIDYVTTTDPLRLYGELREQTFSSVLDRYFDDWELKSVFATLLGNIGLPSSRASALTAVFLYREFIFDGGYYPQGGMQRFADALLEQFEAYGGVALLLSPAEEVTTTPAGHVQSVKIKYRGRQPLEIAARAVVANCDPYQLYNVLLRNVPLSAEHKAELTVRVPTVSAFMLHLGVSHDISREARYPCSVWSYPRGHVDDYYEGVLRGRVEFGVDTFLFYNVPSFHDATLAPGGSHSVQVIIPAPYATRAVWEREKEALAEDLLARLERYLPSVSRWIDVRHIATPATLQKYTWTHRGAMYGWASIIEQVGANKFPDRSAIAGLHLVGHWTGLPSGNSGIPTVVAAGRAVARSVLRELCVQPMAGLNGRGSSPESVEEAGSKLPGGVEHGSTDDRHGDAVEVGNTAGGGSRFTEGPR